MTNAANIKAAWKEALEAREAIEEKIAAHRASAPAGVCPFALRFGEITDAAAAEIFAAQDAHAAEADRLNAAWRNAVNAAIAIACARPRAYFME